MGNGAEFTVRPSSTNFGDGGSTLGAVIAGNAEVATSLQSSASNLGVLDRSISSTTLVRAPGTCRASDW